MYTTTILISSAKSSTSFDILDPKRSKFGPKGPKMGGFRFLNRNLNFLKKDNKISFYTNKYAKVWFPAFIIYLFFYFSFSSYLHKVLTFPSLWNTKNSTIDLPISILLGSPHPNFNRTLLHRFLASFT